MARPIGAKVQPDGGTNAPDIVKKAMKLRGYTLKMMSRELGYSGPTSIWSALDGRNMRIDILVRMLDQLGFDVIVKDRNGSNRENVWKIEQNETEQTDG